MSAFHPAYELMDVGGRLVLLVDLPGIAAQQIRLAVVDERELVVSGHRHAARGRRLAGERPSGEFELRVPLPAPVRRDQFCVEWAAGVLEVELRTARPIDVEHPSTRVGIAGRAIPIE